MRRHEIETPRPLPPRLWTIRETAEFLAVPTSTLGLSEQRCKWLDTPARGLAGKGR